MSIPLQPPETAPIDPLELETLDSDSLFRALTNVEKAIPQLLSSVKPVLAHLVASPEEEEEAGIKARESVENYMSTLDKIQFILRQTVYYLHETRSSPLTLAPIQAAQLQTPFASTLSSYSPPAPGRLDTTSNGADSSAALRDDSGGRGGGGRGMEGVKDDGEEGAEEEEEMRLGLYASRLEVRFLKEMKDALSLLGGVLGDDRGGGAAERERGIRERGDEGMIIEEDDT